MLADMADKYKSSQWQRCVQEERQTLQQDKDEIWKQHYPIEDRFLKAYNTIIF